MKQWKSSLGPVQTLSLKGSLLVQPEEMTFQVKQLKLSLILGQKPAAEGAAPRSVGKDDLLGENSQSTLSSPSRLGW